MPNFRSDYMIKISEVSDYDLFFKSNYPRNLLLPNLIFTKFKPLNLPLLKRVKLKNENLLTIIEKTGQMGIFIIPIFYKIDLADPLNRTALFPMIFSWLVYYGCWLRYFIKKRNYYLLFKPLGGIPIPMAVFPILYMLFAAKILNSFLLLGATLWFA